MIQAENRDSFLLWETNPFLLLTANQISNVADLHIFVSEVFVPEDVVTHLLAHAHSGDVELLAGPGLWAGHGALFKIVWKKDLTVITILGPKKRLL